LDVLTTVVFMSFPPQQSQLPSPEKATARIASCFLKNTCADEEAVDARGSSTMLLNALMILS
jgi:hypothetical protein